MTATRSAQTTTPGSGGADLELLASGTVGVKTPTAAVRAVNPSGDLVDLIATGAGRLQTDGNDTADIRQSGTLTGAGSVTLDVSAVPRGSWSISWPTGTFNPSALLFEVSFDGGTTYLSMSGRRVDTTSVDAATQASSFTNASRVFTGPIPPGATHIRARVTTMTGSITVTVAASSRASSETVALTGQLPTGSNTIGKLDASSQTIGTVNLAANFLGGKIGNVANQGNAYDDTATALGASATYTGTSRDLLGGTGNVPSGFQGINEFRAWAISDVTGTLYYETSRDNVTYRRTDQFVAAQNIPSGLWVARGKIELVSRYGRWVYVNGAGAQTHFQLQSLQVS